MPFSSCKPTGTAPLIDLGNSLSQGQIGWWLANEGAGIRLTNIANRNASSGTLQSGATWQNSVIGRNLAFDGTATSYVDLGTSPLLAGTTPFTLQWLEFVGTSPPTFAAVAGFLPSGNTQRFLIFHEDSNAFYTNFNCGLGSAPSISLFAGAPTLASGVGIWRQWILTGTAGMNGVQNTFRLIVDAVDKGTGTAGGTLSSQTANLNVLGWDGADSKWKGALDNFRLWGRVLGNTEIDRLIRNPYDGVRSSAVRKAGVAGPAGRHRMLLAM